MANSLLAVYTLPGSPPAGGPGRPGRLGAAERTAAGKTRWSAGERPAGHDGAHSCKYPQGGERIVQASCCAHCEHGRAPHGKHEVRCCRPTPESEVHRTASSSRGGTETNDLNAILAPVRGISTRH
jgi:hypothetical protein